MREVKAMQIRNFSEARSALKQFYTFAAEYRLDTLRSFMEHIGNPQDQLRVIHIAGTSGKTSTSYYIAGLLEAAGYTTGLTTSPHVDEINERVQIGLIPLQEAVFCKELGEFLDLVMGSGHKLSYFEAMVAFAYYYFAKAHVDYAVIETGLGGRIDGTNVVSRRDKICVITNIGLDHTKILGDTLPQIAGEKAGIILDGNEVFTHLQDDEILDVFKAVCHERHASLTVVPEQHLPETNELPLFQQHNIGLAVAAVSRALERDGKTLDTSHIATAAKTYIPARMERITYGGKQLIIDGAHNGQKIATLMESLRAAYPAASVAALVAFVGGYEERTQRGLAELTSIVKHLVVTEFTTEQDVPKRALPATQVAGWCAERGFTDFETIADPVVALHALLERSEDILLITGSFYLLNHIRPLIMRA
jgi:dihydrofolate synthase/folylpolyglutamate synthase